jgi:hypothetical protein
LLYQNYSANIQLISGLSKLVLLYLIGYNCIKFKVLIP